MVFYETVAVLISGEWRPVWGRHSDFEVRKGHKMDKKVKKYEQWKRIISIIYLLGYISVSLLLILSIMAQGAAVDPGGALIVSLLVLLITGAAFFLGYIGFYALCDHIIETHMIRKCLERNLNLQKQTTETSSETIDEESDDSEDENYYPTDEDYPKTRKEVSSALQIAIALAIALVILIVILSVVARYI